MKKLRVVKFIIILFFLLFGGIGVAKAGISDLIDFSSQDSQDNWRSSAMVQMDAIAGDNGARYGSSPNDIRDIAGYIIQIVLSVLGTVFVVYMVYAGFLMMTSQGEEEKMKKGQGILRNSSIGMLLVLSAFAITLLVTRILQGEPNFPTNGITIQQPVRNSSDPYSVDMYNLR